MVGYSCIYAMYVYVAVKGIIFRQFSLGYRDHTFLVLKLYSIMYEESNDDVLEQGSLSDVL